MAIIGGGLAGLINGILLSRAGLSVQLFEEKRYPFHRVCGEYISNEVLPFLKGNELFPGELSPAEISQFHLTSLKGNSLHMPLDLGGFGIGRNRLDEWLAGKAQDSGVELIHRRVVNADFLDDYFQLKDKESDSYQARLVIGCFGKRSVLDKQLKRRFMEKRHPYVGIKYHIQTDQVPENVVALHNFAGGYCGVNKIEGDRFNLCYLTHRDNLRTSGSIPEMEQEVLYKNPHLKNIFIHSSFLFDKPEVINEISFEKKEPVYQHLLMSGDSAGMITPLCGNGMAMAIHSASILSEVILKHYSKSFDRHALESEYVQRWNQLFANRLWAGRQIQKLFGAPVMSGMAISLGRTLRPFASYLMKLTHGKPFS